MTIYAMGGTVGGSFGEWRLQQIDGHPAQQTSEYSRSFSFGQVRMTKIKRLLAELSPANCFFKVSDATGMVYLRRKCLVI